MVIRIYDHVKQAYTSEDGEKIGVIVSQIFKSGAPVVLSFEGIDTVTSSFINTSLIPLISNHSFDIVKKNLKIIKSTPHINAMIKKRFEDEYSRIIEAA